MPTSLTSRRFTCASLRSSAGLLAGLVLLHVPREARAQGNAYSAPIGGRSALMGNTGVAMGIDGAAPFLNPATIVRLDDHRFAFSVNFYSFSLSRFSNWHQPGAVDTAQFGNVSVGANALTSSGFGVLPSTLCLFFTLAPGSPDANADMANLDSWRQKLAICLGTSETQGVGFSALPFNGTTPLGQTAQSQSLVQSWNRVNIGPSYSVAVSKRLAIGLSVHGVYTNDSFILDSSGITSSVKNGAVQSSLGVAGGGSSFDVSAILGAIFSAAPYTFGLSFTLPAVHALGSYTGTMHNEYGSGGTENATISNGTGSFSAAPPIRLALGAGVEWPRLSLEVDESLYVPSPTGFNAAVSGTTTTLAGTTVATTPFSANFSVHETPVLNTAAGAEYFIKKDFSLVGGTSFNMSALPALAPTTNIGNLVQARQSEVTASLGVGTYSQGGALMLGFQLGYGWGESIAANPYVTPNELAVVDTRSYSAIFILAGSTNLRSLGRAVVRIEHVISGDPEGPSSAPFPPSNNATSPRKPPAPPLSPAPPKATPLAPTPAPPATFTSTTPASAPVAPKPAIAPPAPP
jgi:hypothetical protein